MESQEFCLKWNNYHSNLATQFTKLFESNDHADVTIACEGQSRKAHKLVLSAFSPFFHELLLNNPNKHPIVILNDFKFQDIEGILNYVYKGEVNITNARLGSFLKAASALQIKGLNNTADENENQKDWSASMDEGSPKPKRRRQQRSSINERRDETPERDFRSPNMLINKSAALYPATPLSIASRAAYKEHPAQASTSSHTVYNESGYFSQASTNSHADYKKYSSQAKTTFQVDYREQKYSSQAKTTPPAVYKEQKHPSSQSSTTSPMMTYLEPQASQSFNGQTNQQSSNMCVSYGNTTQETLEDDDDCIIEDIKPMVPLSSSVDLPVMPKPISDRRPSTTFATQNQLELSAASLADGNQYNQVSTSIPLENELVDDAASFTAESEYIDDPNSFGFEIEPHVSGIERLPSVPHGPRSENNLNELSHEPENMSSQASTSQVSGTELFLSSTPKRALEVSEASGEINKLLSKPFKYFLCPFCAIVIAAITKLLAQIIF